MLRHFLVGSVICIGSLVTAEADAQLVRIGPLGGVSIRVPFVSVDVDPWGGTRVRAPFTAVDAPGHGYHHHHSYYDHHGHHYGIPLYDLPRYGYSLPYDAYSQPYQPYALPYEPYADRAGDTDPYAALPRRPYQSRELADLDGDAIELPYSPYDADWLRSREAELGSVSSADRVAAASSGYAAASAADSALRRALADAARRLDAALQQRSDGQVWQDYLQPLRIADAADSSAASSDAGQLRELLDNFEGVTANNSLDWVTRLDGFDATRLLLRQWVSADGQIAADSATSDDSEMQLSEPASDAPAQRLPLEAEELPPPAPQPETPTRYEA